jgi:hypothetical protein
VRGGLGHDRHGFGGLLAAHHGGLGVGPGETEARMEAAPAHAVIAGAERRAAIDRDLRHVAEVTAWIIFEPCLIMPASS